MTEEDWHAKLFEADEEKRIGPFGAKGFSLKHATEEQRESIEFLAAQIGRTHLTFWQWVKAAKQTYYDLIKVASP